MLNNMHWISDDLLEFMSSFEIILQVGHQFAVNKGDCGSNSGKIILL